MPNRKSMPEKNSKGGKNQKFRNKKKPTSDRRPVDGRCNDLGRTNYREGDNDLSWYSKYPQLLVAGASFPYPYRPGMDIKLGKVNVGTDTPNIVDWSYRIPGVLSLAWLPSVGVSNTVTDPASVMAKELYAKVRSKYSGSLDADAPDFVMYLMALDSVYAYIAWLKRLYRTLNAWTPLNHALPDTLLAGYRVSLEDAETMRLNKTQLWQCINELILQARKFVCPAVMDVFNRHYWMSDNVYLDDATMNSQIYCFNPAGYYQLSQVAIPGDATNTAAGLKIKLMPMKKTVDSLYRFGLDLISAIAEWDDGYTISGYLMRAFEGVNSFTVDDLMPDEILTPVYSPEVLTQIQNSFTLGEPMFTDDGSLDVAQNPLTNVIVSNPGIATSKASADKIGLLRAIDGVLPMFSMGVDNPGPADNVIASRLNALFKYNGEGTVGSVPVYKFTVDCGTEIPLAWNYWSVPIGTSSTTGYNCTIRQVVVAPRNSTWETLQMAVVTQFNKSPLIRMAVQDPVIDDYHFGMIGDVHNITTVSAEDLANLHKICLYSEFNAFSI